MVISIINHKGGVGKTTTTISLGAALAQLGNKVLLVDFDSQSNLSQSLGFRDDENRKNIYGVLREKYSLEIFKVKENLDVVTSTLDLAAADLELANEVGGVYILKEKLKPVRDVYDYVLIDCAPSLGMLTMSALTASDAIVIPLQAEFLAMNGIVKLLSMVDKIKNRLNPELNILGYLITQYDGRLTLNRTVVETVQKQFGGDVFKTFIRSNIALAEAPTTGTDIFEYSPKSNGAEDYLGLAKELIKKL